MSYPKPINRAGGWREEEHKPSSFYLSLERLSGNSRFCASSSEEHCIRPVTSQVKCFKKTLIGGGKKERKKHCLHSFSAPHRPINYFSAQHHLPQRREESQTTR